MKAGRVVLFAGLLLAGALSPHPQAIAKTEQAQRSQDAGGDAAARARTAAQATTGVQQQTPCGERDPGDGGHQCADWYSALAAERAVHWAKLSVLLGLFSLMLSGGGLIALLKTIGQGSRALKEAEKSNSIAAETAEREHRAYVGISKVSLGTTGRSVVIEVKNFGRTSAREISVHFAVGPPHGDNSITDARSFGIIDPGMAYKVERGFDHHQLAGQAATVWPIVVTLQYDDIFGGQQTRVSEFVHPGSLGDPPQDVAWICIAATESEREKEG